LASPATAPIPPVRPGNKHTQKQKPQTSTRLRLFGRRERYEVRDDVVRVGRLERPVS